MDLVELMGKGYVIDNYISFFNDYQRRKSFWIYTTDALKALTNNTANHKGALVINQRFADIINPKPQEERTEEEVIDTIIEKLKGV